MQNMGDIMGEVNMIFSLAFAFLENGKYEEAEKLFKVSHSVGTLLLGGSFIVVTLYSIIKYRIIKSCSAEKDL